MVAKTCCVSSDLGGFGVYGLPVEFVEIRGVVGARLGVKISPDSKVAQPVSLTDTAFRLAKPKNKPYKLLANSLEVVVLEWLGKQSPASDSVRWL